MRLNKNWLLAVACAGYSSVVGAATLIEERDSESRTLMYVDDGKMRVETRGEPGYALMDLRRRTILMVDPDEKTAIEMSPQIGDTSNSDQGKAPKVEVGLEKVGVGPSVAGYATDHYVLTANGRKCQDLFVSKQAFADSGWAALWSEFGTVFKSMSAMDMDKDACDIADEQADPARIGWPLKTVASDGETTEVLRIEKDVPVPAGGFEVPGDYRIMSLQEMMSGAFGGGSGFDEDD